MGRVNKIDKILRQLFIYMVKLYQILISPLLGANKCRFNPSCSQYMIEAIAKNGILKGIYVGTKRILRCHPFCEGGYDPIK